MAWRQTPLNMLDRVITWLAAFLLGTGVAFMCYQIIVRFLVGAAYDWGGAMILAGVVSAYLLAAGPIIRTDSHSRVDFLIIRMKGQKREVMELALAIVTLLVLVFLFVSSIAIVQTLKRYGVTEQITLDIQSWIVHLPLPIGLGGCVIFAAEKVARRANSFISRPSE